MRTESRSNFELLTIMKWRFDVSWFINATSLMRPPTSELIGATHGLSHFAHGFEPMKWPWTPLEQKRILHDHMKKHDVEPTVEPNRSENFARMSKPFSALNQVIDHKDRHIRHWCEFLVYWLKEKNWVHQHSTSHKSWHWTSGQIDQFWVMKVFTDRTEWIFYIHSFGERFIRHIQIPFHRFWP